MSTSLSVERRLVRALYEAATHAREAGLPGMAEDLDRHRVAAEANVVAQESADPGLEEPELDRLLRIPSGSTVRVSTTGSDREDVLLILDRVEVHVGSVVIHGRDADTLLPASITRTRRRQPGGQGNPGVRPYRQQTPYRPAGPGGAGRW